MALASRNITVSALSPFLPPPIPSTTSATLIPLSHSQPKPNLILNLNNKTATYSTYYNNINHQYSKSFRRLLYRFSTIKFENDYESSSSFNEAVALFNERAYYECHDTLEVMWYNAEEPTRTLIHGILQCAVGFYHLFNQNHKGAMMELGEGLCKLRKMKFSSGPFHQFEQEISATLDFIYQTQIELAACADDMCLAMDQSERSYQLLGDYGAGQHLYHLQSDDNGIMYIVFHSQRAYDSKELTRVKLPILNATEEHLIFSNYN